MSLAQFTGHVWMDVEHNYNNTWQYIDATTLAEHLRLIMCEAIPGFHIFTGTYYTQTQTHSNSIYLTKNILQYA